MPILGILASSTPVGGDYESIATVTVGSGGSSSISFSSIPSTFAHLQLRCFVQTNRSDYGIDQINVRVNGDTGNNYAWHLITGDGANTNASSGTSVSRLFNFSGTTGTTAGSSFGTTIIDLLDYASTSKYKTGRALSGVDINGTILSLGGRIGLFSGLWMNTAAINSLTITPDVGSSLNQYSHFALYGIKSA